MVATRVLSTEDGKLGQTTLIATRTRQYQDIDLTFAKRPSGDIYKKKDAAAVKQAVKNLLLTNHYEKPFLPFYGGDLRALLFELADDTIESDVYDRVRKAIETYEPRVQIIQVDVNAQPEINDLSVTIVFKVISTNEQVSYTTNLTRLR